MTPGELEDARHAWLDLQRRLTALQIQVHNERDPARLADLEEHLRLTRIAHDVAQDRYFYLRRRSQDGPDPRIAPRPRWAMDPWPDGDRRD